MNEDEMISSILDSVQPPDEVLLKIKRRLEANLEILRLLEIELRRHPDTRFGQVLKNTRLDRDLFYEESVDTLYRLRKSLEELGP
jgi:hypothetical protein